MGSFYRHRQFAGDVNCLWRGCKTFRESFGIYNKSSFNESGTEHHSLTQCLGLYRFRETAIEMAEQWLTEEGLLANLIQYRMEDGFPYDDMLFDAVISIQVIHHNRIHAIKSTITEIERVLRPGGDIFITVPVLLEGPVPPEDDWDLKEVEPGTYIPQRGPESGVLHHYFTEEGILEAFSAFKITKLFIDETGHRCILGTKN